MESSQSNGVRCSLSLFLCNFIIELFYCLLRWSENNLMKSSQKWNLHRISSLSLIFTTLAFLIFFFSNFQLSQSEVQTKLSYLPTKFLVFFFFLNALFHARLELWSIYDDYFKSTQRKIFQITTYAFLIIILILVLPILGAQ